MNIFTLIGYIVLSPLIIVLFPLIFLISLLIKLSGETK